MMFFLSPVNTFAYDELRSIDQIPPYHYTAPYIGANGSDVLYYHGQSGPEKLYIDYYFYPKIPNASSMIRVVPDDFTLRHIDKDGHYEGVNISAYTGDITSTGVVSANGFVVNNGKIIGVADGEITETSKDAINGSQLYKALQKFGKVDITSYDIIGANVAALAALHPLPYEKKQLF